MLGNLSKFFDAEFGIRCFLPSLFLILGSVCIHDFLLGSAELSRLLPNTSNRIETLAGSLYVGFLAWVCGVLISAIQRELVRTLEGYGRFNPLNIAGIFRRRQVSKYRSLMIKQERLVERVWQDVNQKPSKSTQEQLNEIGQTLSTQFPSDESKILPTSFGNSMRTLEEYPDIMYGLDGVTGWTRLQSVIPSEYQIIVNEQRLYRDFWVNSCFVVAILIAEVFLLFSIRPQNTMIAIILLLFLMSIAWWSYENANDAAQRFGDYVKSSFDLYIDELRQKLRLPQSDNPRAQREMWTKAIQGYTYRRSEILDEVFEHNNKDEG